MVHGGKTIRSEGRPKGGGKAGGFAVSPKDDTEGLHWMEMGLKPGELQGFPEEPGGPLLRVGWAVELSWARGEDGWLPNAPLHHRRSRTTFPPSRILSSPQAQPQL